MQSSLSQLGYVCMHDHIRFLVLIVVKGSQNPSYGAVRGCLIKTCTFHRREC